MMIEMRPFSQLGRFQNEWLDANYHFSFSHYHDPKRMGLGQLRVWNDDTIKAHSGFAPHGHKDMEIITYVRTGAISHRDSLGNEGRTEAGDVQIMSAGSGIQHSEMNREDIDTTLFQIWINPAETGHAPRWGAKKFPKSDRSGRWAILASGSDDDDALPLRQDAKVLGATIKAGQPLSYQINQGRFGYLVIAHGSAKLNGQTLTARDGVAIIGDEHVEIVGLEEAEIVLVDTV